MLEKLGSPTAAVSHASLTGLDRLRAALGEESIGTLICSASDYLVNAISLNLRCVRSSSRPSLWDTSTHNFSKDVPVRPRTIPGGASSFCAQPIRPAPTGRPLSCALHWNAAIDDDLDHQTNQVLGLEPTSADGAADDATVLRRATACFNLGLSD
jgi:hypothetical protein